MDEERPTSGSKPAADPARGSSAAIGAKRPREGAQAEGGCEGPRQGQRKHCCLQSPQQPTNTPPAPADETAAKAAVAESTICPPEDHPLDPNAPKRSQLPPPSGNTPPDPPVSCTAAIAEATAAAAAAVAVAATAAEQGEAGDNAAQLLPVINPPQLSRNEE
ncbi:unnamed protein product, partial [Laminaria digitata]